MGRTGIDGKQITDNSVTGDDVDEIEAKLTPAKEDIDDAEKERKKKKLDKAHLGKPKQLMP